MKLGKRGTGGESSLSQDSTYDISNLARLGQTEVGGNKTIYNHTCIYNTIIYIYMMVLFRLYFKNYQMIKICYIYAHPQRRFTCTGSDCPKPDNNYEAYGYTQPLAKRNNVFLYY